MSSTVKSRPNRYEVLGLTPGASKDEIARAFARELSDLRPRPFGSLAEVTVAYETLRDRDKREAYDISLGLKPNPKPPSSPPVVPQEWASFALHASARPAARPAMDPLPRSAPKADTPHGSESIDEPKMSPFAAATSPGEPSNADFRELHQKPRAPTEQSHRPEASATPRLELPAGGELLHFDESRRFQINGPALSQWKIPALAAGALILAVGLGVWTGLEAGNDNERAPTQNAVTLKVPAAKPLPVLAGSPLTPATTMENPPQRSTRASAPRVEQRTRPPLQIDLPKERPDDGAQFGQGPADEIAAGQAPAESPSFEATVAKLPLSKAAIARTIGRIGYPCGQVSAATAMEGGAPGVFKVTCTSGHSYRAAPVRGRYRFRQLGNH
jgi:hypothetical protein